MSFVPAPQQANAALSSNSNATVNASSAAAAATAPAPAAGAGVTPEAISDQELIFKMRTFDVYWVEKHALMYRDGFAKVRERSCFVVGNVRGAIYRSN
jgi:hypothetical protein